jgi:hypothetical protein
VPDDSGQVDAQGIDIERQLAEQLGGVAGGQGAMVMSDASEVIDRLERPSLVLGRQDRDEYGPRVIAASRSPGSTSLSLSTDR